MNDTEAEVKSKRTTVSTDAKFDNLLEDINASNFLGLKGATNGDLLLFASALGWQKGLNPPIEKKKSGGLARTDSFTPFFDSVIHAMHFATIGYDHPDGLRNQNEALDLMEKYANGGMHLIQSEFDANKSSEEVANGLITEMDKLYREFCN